MSKVYPNESLIVELMRKAGLRGNVRNYIVLVGTMLLDYKGSYPVQREHVESPGMDLMHKRDLASVIGTRAAQEFWNPRLGMRVKR